MQHPRRIGSLVCGLGVSLSLQAQAPSWQWGAQAALTFPASPDLRLTADWPSLSVGLHGAWTLQDRHQVTPRLDYTRFQPETQMAGQPALLQRIDTEVTSLALGVDYTYRLGEAWGVWRDVAVGVGLAEIRWNVASVNRIDPALGGSVQVAGTSHWTRLGIGPVLQGRLTDHLSLDLRHVLSHYGQENQVAATTSLGLLWHF